MKFVSDPPISVKIEKMRSRVRYGQPALRQQGINQTYLVLEDGQSQDKQFSFLVMGDSGSESYHNDHPQRRVAEAMAELRSQSRFVLHTGDVVYLVGSREQYPANFIQPYREFLRDGHLPSKIAYDQMVFNTPIFPVLGNHDYYDLPLLFGLLSKLTAPIRRLLRNQVTIDIGWHGSWQGDTYARAFLDYLQFYEGDRLQNHLAQHYKSRFNQQPCLSYNPGIFTRLPNRYYRFRYGSIDFFALDSNTFRQPLTIPDNKAGRALRLQLNARKARYLRLKQRLITQILKLDAGSNKQAENLQETYVRLEQIEEEIKDVDQQLNLDDAPQTVDDEQLDWLTKELIQSWQDPEAKGRILFFHHPPYVTEESKWNNGETLAIRHHLRGVLDQVETVIGGISGGRSLVDLVFTGHAHCLEYLRTGETGHGDRNIPWLVCGGSGFSLRQQRREGKRIEEQPLIWSLEEADANLELSPSVIATSHLFVGRSGRGSQKRRPYSFLKVDVDTQHEHPRIYVTPQIVERAQGDWSRYAADTIDIAR